GVSYLDQMIGNWVLLVISLGPMLYVVVTLKDHSEDALPADTVVKGNGGIVEVYGETVDDSTRSATQLSGEEKAQQYVV
ncbi:hypothetical protein IW150_000700, partial [Coemansia sp. RSA 2607]